MKEKLRLENILAESGGIKLLDDFYMSLEEGQTLGIYIKEQRIKDILIDILDGVHTPLNGYFYYDDKQVDRLSKIHVVEGRSKLIDGMTISNNIFVLRPGFKEQFISDKLLNQQAKRLLDELGIDLDPRLKINQLTNFEKVQIELAKAYGLGHEVIILKDLSAYYSDAELEELNDLMDYMISKSKSFVIIDSFYDILSKFSSQVIWVKNGKNKWVIKDQLPDAFLKELVIESSHDEEIDDLPVLSFVDVNCQVIKDFKLSIHRGEVINIFDRDGEHLNCLTDMILGRIRPSSGKIVFKDSEIKIKNLDYAIDKGIGFIGVNPTVNTLFPDLTCLDNLCYLVSRKVKNFWMLNRYKKSILAKFKDKFDDMDASIYIDDMSIFDRQRLVYYRWLAYKPDVVIVQRPFTSVDQMLRQLTYDLINELSSQGISVILMSVNKAEMFSGRYYEMN
ncbi:sugar ABC transporter ATP-binding protein [Acidaminobacter sp. JC074]|uniref:ATP-binding cassette domain-containing protein n=1 Tax=Acidaminobacter sp. JC074 TaxID=2530199 RepID=UPI001F0E2EB1|nr:ATP-binding cassette domain-containing protein [Acidaminobacter sp. JC074]MCH4887952.1 sugar ABC transporter ATP-binding protein [Acidaminobacter sp. JC074]